MPKWFGCGALAVALLAALMHAERRLRLALDELEALPQPIGYEALVAPLQDASREAFPVVGGRRLSSLVSPHGASGKAVVLVHGFKMHATSWSVLWNELRRAGHRVLALDLPGHGESGFSREALELDSLAGDIRAAADHFDVANAVLVGHSMGGLIALKYLVDHAAHAAQKFPLGFACVACTAGCWGHFVGGAGGNWHGSLLMRSGLFDLLMRSDRIAQLLMAKKFGRPSLPAVRLVVEASRVGASRASLRRLSDLPWEHDLHPNISSIGVPSVVVVGELDDHHAHPAMSEALRDSFAATGLLRAYTVVPEAGHFLPLVKPKEVAAELGHLLT